MSLLRNIILKPIFLLFFVILLVVMFILLLSFIPADSILVPRRFLQWLEPSLFEALPSHKHDTNSPICHDGGAMLWVQAAMIERAANDIKTLTNTTMSHETLHLLKFSRHQYPYSLAESVTPENTCSGAKSKNDISHTHGYDEERGKVKIDPNQCETANENIPFSKQKRSPFQSSMQQYPKWRDKIRSSLPTNTHKFIRFYLSNFGQVSAERSHLDKGYHKYDNIVYYRIYKAANNHIRASLYLYSTTTLDDAVCCKPIETTMKEENNEKSPDSSSLSSGSVSTPVSSTPIHQASQELHNKKVEYICDVDMCGSMMPTYVEFQQSFFLRKIFPASMKRFAFTFTRHPIDRFISAYTEIEHRSQDCGRNLHLVNPIGTEDRFKEFVRFVISSTMEFQHSYNEHSEMLHIVPYIGTLHIGREQHREGLRLFKMEHFASEWQRLADESSFNLDRVAQESQLAPHDSSKDGLHTTKAAKTFLAPHYSPSSKSHTIKSLKRNNTESNDSSTLSSFTINSSSDESLVYLRALCRMYLSDFICANYSLPYACSDILMEVSPLLMEHSKMSLHRRLTLSILHFMLPSPLLKIVASIRCLLARTPSCVSDFIYGDDDEE